MVDSSCYRVSLQIVLTGVELPRFELRDDPQMHIKRHVALPSPLV